MDDFALVKFRDIIKYRQCNYIELHRLHSHRGAVKTTNLDTIKYRTTPEFPNILSNSFSGLPDHFTSPHAIVVIAIALQFILANSSAGELKRHDEIVETFASYFRDLYSARRLPETSGGT